MKISRKSMIFFVRTVSVLYFTGLCVFWAAPFWPREFWWLASLIQMAPLWVLYYPLGFFFILGLVLREKKLVIIHILCLLIILFGIMGFKWHIFSPSNAKTPLHPKVRILSVNMGNADDLTSLFQYISRADPDIVIFQETEASLEDDLRAILPSRQWDVSFDQHLGMATRFIIRKSTVINRRIIGGYGGMIGEYVLDGPMGIFYFFNVHLETSREGVEAMMQGIHKGIPEMKRVTDIQERETAIAAEMVSEYQPVLVAGDFNILITNPIYRKYWSKYRNTFSKAGRGFGYSKYTSWHGVRIDHILCDDFWRVLDAHEGPDFGGDHVPVFAEVAFIGNL